jgi:hypothetical protein
MIFPSVISIHGKELCERRAECVAEMHVDATIGGTRINSLRVRLRHHPPIISSCKSRSCSMHHHNDHLHRIQLHGKYGGRVVANHWQNEPEVEAFDPQLPHARILVQARGSVKRRLSLAEWVWCAEGDCMATSWHLSLSRLWRVG